MQFRPPLCVAGNGTYLPSSNGQLREYLIYIDGNYLGVRAPSHAMLLWPERRVKRVTLPINKSLCLFFNEPHLPRLG
jgi:hypothetical protein